jgi:hypothetical protein
MPTQADIALATHYLEDILFTFRFYQELGRKALDQVADEDLDWGPDEEANSLAILVRHLEGNMLSRWTDFLTSDGEKSWRERDLEFEPPDEDRTALMGRWDRGWACLYSALEGLSAEDLLRTAPIRGKEHTVVQAIHRQLGHYAYHVGQIVQLARQVVGPGEWQTLSIARGESIAYRPEGRI